MLYMQTQMPLHTHAHSKYVRMEQRRRRQRIWVTPVSKVGYTQHFVSPKHYVRCERYVLTSQYGY